MYYNNTNNRMNNDYEKIVKKMSDLEEIYWIESRISENNNKIIILKIQNIVILSLDLILIMLTVLTQINLTAINIKALVLISLIILLSIVALWNNKYVEDKIKLIERKNDRYMEQINLIKNKK